jgi:AraC family transcriptional activator of tynA and feaB
MNTPPKNADAVDARRLLEWTTEGLPDSQKLEYWTDAVSSTLFEMGMITPVKRGFRSFVEAVSLDEIVVATLGGSQREAVRGKEYISRSNSHSFHILVDYVKPWILNWRGDMIRLEPGDMALSDTRYVHSGIYPEESLSGRHNIKLSPQWLGVWLREPDKMVGRRIPGDSGWGMALSTFLAQLTTRFALAPPLPPKLIVDHLGALLSLVESEFSPAEAPRATEIQQASKIADTIRQRSSELTLKAPDVAKAMGISERTLHRHLKAAGSTFSGLLLDSRVETARRMLESSHLRLLTTLEIGIRAGFGDPSHYVRVMHSRLGLAPGAYRKALVSGQ